MLYLCSWAAFERNYVEMIQVFRFWSNFLCIDARTSDIEIGQHDPDYADTTLQREPYELEVVEVRASRLGRGRASLP